MARYNKEIKGNCIDCGTMLGVHNAKHPYQKRCNFCVMECADQRKERGERWKELRKKNKKRRNREKN